MTPTSSGTGAKILTAFLAGAMFGAFSMVEFAPTGASGPGGRPVVIPVGGNPGDGPVLGDFDGLADLDGDVIADLVDQGVISQEDALALAPSVGGGAMPGVGPAGPGGGQADSGGGPTDPTDGSTDPDSGGTDPARRGQNVNIAGEGGGGGGGETGSTGGGGGADNGGATDKGVDATKIRVAATVVDDGPGASLLQSAKIGMQAVINKANRGGGISGRQIELVTRNDGWDAAVGQGYLRRFIEEDFFALLVVPSSEGLARAIEAGDISRAQIPVVGSTGLRTSEYGDPWVFPVATATVSIMRIMADHAAKSGATSFGIVYDTKYRFGIEGKDAFVNFIRERYGRDAITDRCIQGLNPDDPSYGTQAQNFGGCDADMVALLLVPETALKWANANPGDTAGRGRKMTYGAQTLFTGGFANSCRGWCNQMVVWTGYVPPIPPVDGAAGVQEYVNDVRSISGGVDVTNQFLEGAYLGTKVFVDVARMCSPALTRQCVQEKLHQNTFRTDLASQLSWAPNQRHANRTAQAFRIQATGGSFNGWEYLRTGWIADPGL